MPYARLAGPCSGRERTHVSFGSANRAWCTEPVRLLWERSISLQSIHRGTASITACQLQQAASAVGLAVPAKRKR
jgi:hypothetical protein